MSNISQQPQYTDFIRDVIAQIRSAQYEALRVVNKRQIQLYWDLGKQIVEKQTELGWGKSVVELMAKDIQTAFPTISGFSARNLCLMRQFYETYVASEILQPMVAKIGWSHNHDKSEAEGLKKFFKLRRIKNLKKLFFYSSK